MNTQSNKQSIAEYLTTRDPAIPIPQTEEQLLGLLLHLLKENDQIISGLSGQITKYKCQGICQAKVISSLQEKINKLQPNANNTASNFMMPSEFTQSFLDFMNSEFVMAFSSILEFPKLYAEKAQETFKIHYDKVGDRLKMILLQISSIMGIDGKEQRIFNSLLRVFQDNSTELIPYQLLKPSFPSKRKYKDALEQVFGSEQYTEMGQKLHKLCVYMQLQEKKWEFAYRGNVVVKFVKKEHQCIEGFLKESRPAICVLDGLVRDGQMHAKLQNYVVPFEEEEEEEEEESDIEEIYLAIISMDKREEIQSKSAKKIQQRSVVGKIESQKVPSQQKEIDKYSEQIVRVKFEPQEPEKMTKSPLTLHKLLMQKNKNIIIREEAKVNNWFAQKRLQLQASNHNKSKEKYEDIAKKVKNHDIVKFIGNRKGLSEISLKQHSAKIKIHRQDATNRESNIQNVEPNRMKKLKSKRSLERVQSSPKMGKGDSLKNLDSSFCGSQYPSEKTKHPKKTKQEYLPGSEELQEEIRYMKEIRERARSGLLAAEPTFEEPLVFQKKTRYEQDRILRRPKKGSVGKIISQKDGKVGKNSKTKLIEGMKENLMEPQYKSGMEWEFRREECRPFTRKLRDKFIS